MNKGTKASFWKFSDAMRAFPPIYGDADGRLFGTSGPAALMGVVATHV
jgi:hypothetical protein